MKNSFTIKTLLAITSFLGFGTEAIAQDVSVTSIDLPSQCGTPEFPITINVSNLGAGAQTNLNVFYQVNNGTVVSEVIPITILSNANENYTFNQSADLGNAGSYDIKAWVALPSDVNNANDTTTTVLSYTAPTVNVTSAAFCEPGTVLDFVATGGNDNYIWYSESSASFLGLDDTLTVTANQDETYQLFLRDSVINMTISQIGATTDHDVLSGDDRGGIAVTNQHVYFNGDVNCARFNLNLSSGVSLPRRDGIFSDLATGQLYTLFNTSIGAPIGPNIPSYVVDAIVTMDVDLNFVDTIMLSQPITMGGAYANTNQAGIYAGEGHLLLYTGIQGNNWYVIDLPSGNVTFINSFVFNTKSSNENWSSWGFSVYAAGAYRATHTNYSNQEIRSMNTVSGVWSTIQTFNNMSDMASITYSPLVDRIYFHHEANSQFGGFNETGGYMDAGVPTYEEANVPYAGCPATTIINVSTSSVSLGDDTTFCGGSSLTLDAGNFDTYQWSTGTTNQTVDVDVTGIYSVLATDAYGCQRVDTIDVTVLALPSPDLGIDTAFCEGSSLVLNPGAGFSSYDWDNGSTDQTLIVNAAGTYSVIVSDGMCSNSDEIVISENANPIIDLGPDQTIDFGTSTTLSVGGNYAAYNWSTNETTSTIDFTGYTDSYITLVVTDNNGCQGEDGILITVDGGLGLETLEEGIEFSMYPNPVAEVLNLDISMSESAALELLVTDISGKQIMNKTILTSVGENNISIPIEDWASGVYVTTISLNGNTMIQEKLIKR